MAIGSAYSSALSGMNAAAYQMLGAAQGAGNLNDLAGTVMKMETAKMQFDASAKVAEMQSNVTNAAIDMLA
jgi:hypothetical protein